MLRTSLIASCALVGLTATAQASVFDFDAVGIQDTLISSITSDDGLVTASLAVVANRNAFNSDVDAALVFDTENGADNDSDLQSTFLKDDDASVTADAGGVLAIAENDLTGGQLPDDNANGGTITFTFLEAVNFTGFAIYDDANITVTSDLGGSLNRSVAIDGRFNVFSFDDSLFQGVTELTFDFGNASGAIDDIQVSLSAVPVPAALPLLLAGLGGLGLMGRRRKAA